MLITFQTLQLSESSVLLDSSEEALRRQQALVYSRYLSLRITLNTIFWMRSISLMFSLVSIEVKTGAQYSRTYLVLMLKK